MLNLAYSQCEQLFLDIGGKLPKRKAIKHASHVSEAVEKARTGAPSKKALTARLKESAVKQGQKFQAAGSASGGVKKKATKTKAKAKAKKKACKLKEAPQKGFCVTAKGHDQNSGVKKINAVDGNTCTTQSACLKACKATPGATGCEVIWHQGNRGCYAHTKSIAKGNGVARHMCWVFKKKA